MNDQHLSEIPSADSGEAKEKKGASTHPSASTPKKKKKSIFTVHAIARIAVFSAIAIVLYVLPFPPFNFPIFPAVPFLNIHFDEVPALIAGFAYGPLTGFFVLTIRTLVKLPFSTTGMIGEFADWLFSISFIVPAAFYYRSNRTLKGAIVSLIIGSLSQTLVAVSGNLYFIADWFNNLYNGNLFSAMSMSTYIKWLIPFNLIKDILVSLVTFATYKSVHKLFDRL